MLRPVFQRQPPRMQAMKDWNELRLSGPSGPLDETNQAPDDLPIRKQLALEYPHDCDVQLQYAQALTTAKETKAACAWLKVLVPEARWSASAEAQLRNVYALSLSAQGRYDESIACLAAWCKQGDDRPQVSYWPGFLYFTLSSYADYLAARWKPPAGTKRLMH